MGVRGPLTPALSPEAGRGGITDQKGTRMRTWLGQPYPLGATWDGAGVNFALFAENATKVELCLFDGRESTKETHRLVLPEREGGIEQFVQPRHRDAERRPALVIVEEEETGEHATGAHHFRHPQISIIW